MPCGCLVLFYCALPSLVVGLVLAVALVLLFLVWPGLLYCLVLCYLVILHALLVGVTYSLAVRGLRQAIKIC